jgi:NhaP-type Na+/H+ or K+/H+ antiporter
MLDFTVTIILAALAVLVIGIAVGYWCMRVFRRKGRQPGAGFTLGILLTLFLPVVGALIALIITYSLRPVRPSAPPRPLEPDGDPVETAGR